MSNKKDKEIDNYDYSKLYEDAWNYFYNKKKLPENPFKETDKLAEKLTLDIADKTDKALIDSLNDLIKAGILEVKVLEPMPFLGEPGFWIKSGVQVVPKFDEYTKKLESENFELKKQLIYLSEQQSERIQRTVNDKQYIMKLEAEVESLKERIESDTGLIKKLADSEFQLRKENETIKSELFDDLKVTESNNEHLKKRLNNLTTDLTTMFQAMDSLKKFLSLEDY